MNTYDFPVELMPIEAIHPSTQRIAVPKKFAVVRTDTMRPLGIVSDKYDLLRHETVVSAFHAAIHTNSLMAWSEQIKMSKFGARMTMKLTFPDTKVRIAQGDEVAMQLLVQNSYDGSKALTILFGAFRFVCENGMVIGRKFIHFSRKHIGQQLEPNVEEIRQHIGSFAETFQNTAPVMQRMAETPFAAEPQDWFNPKQLTMPEYLALAALAQYQNQPDKTLWGAYNALTNVITHGMKKESPEAQLNYGRRAWEVALKELPTA